MSFARTFCLVLALVLGLCAATAWAELSASLDEGNLGAKATFAQSGNNLIVTLENTAGAGAVVPTDVLTGVFFELSGVTLAPVSAVLGGSSVVLNPESGSGVDANGTVSGEFAYRSGLSLDSQLFMAISSVGMGDLIGPPDLFPGPDLSQPVAPDGLNYGIVSGIDANANSKVTDVPLVRDAVIFTLSGLPAGFDLADHLDLADVAFNYGTGLDPHENTFHTPVPGAALLGVIGLSLVGLVHRRRS